MKNFLNVILLTKNNTLDFTGGAGGMHLYSGEYPRFLEIFLYTYFHLAHKPIQPKSPANCPIHYACSRQNCLSIDALAASSGYNCMRPDRRAALSTSDCGGDRRETEQRPAPQRSRRPDANRRSRRQRRPMPNGHNTCIEHSVQPARCVLLPSPLHHESMARTFVIGSRFFPQ
jgi:hypothetical protein